MELDEKKRAEQRFFKCDREGNMSCWKIPDWTIPTLSFPTAMPQAWLKINVYFNFNFKIRDLLLTSAGFFSRKKLHSAHFFFHLFIYFHPRPHLVSIYMYFGCGCWEMTDINLNGPQYSLRSRKLSLIKSSGAEGDLVAPSARSTLPLWATPTLRVGECYWHPDKDWVNVCVSVCVQLGICAWLAL